MIKQDIPKIRFYSYQGAWTENKITDIVKISAGGDVDKERLKESGKYPVVANSLTNKGIVGFYDDYKVKAPAVTVTGRGDVGYAVARHENFTPIVRLLTLQSDNIDVDYLENQINSMRILNESTGVPQLTAPQLGNYKVYHPEIDEQSAIGSLFRTLDDLLASYKDNLANYQSLKATMLTKMFPKAGQTVPEIRLDGFEGEWGKYYLGDIFEQVSNYIEPSVENELWSLTVEKGLTPKTERYKRDFLVKKNDKFKKVDVNEFVYNPMNLTLGALDLNNNDVTISVSGYYVVMKNIDIEKFDNDFLKILLKTTYAIYQYKQFATGTLIEKQRVQFPTFSEIPFYLPTIAEQQAIGSFFSNLDNLINSHQEKISQLETLKKKLLQDMFI
ncbi:restriction endonuclease subunit S [Streptococcus xiaochunlingii]|uniref:Restriction endonuclease subunit S n=1 Tax=Streptococcus xiaochunlingii TaxID=2589788 RepID=A0ABY2YEJ5_9STRE|nr:restriction endonuclease subunit S [Streptococcus xiaochunlingii]TPE38115.1 restriction endonuclease subunit S [Streptococcus xiaochunlingii]